MTMESAIPTPSTPRQSPLLGLLIAQFLGAFNDNMYKMILSLLAVYLVGDAAGGRNYLPLIGAVFILPFLLFSGYAGYVADVYSKRRVLIATKGLEIVAMGLGWVTFMLGRLDLMLLDDRGDLRALLG